MLKRPRLGSNLYRRHCLDNCWRGRRRWIGFFHLFAFVYTRHSRILSAIDDDDDDDKEETDDDDDGDDDEFCVAFARDKITSCH